MSVLVLFSRASREVDCSLCVLPCLRLLGGELCRRLVDCRRFPREVRIGVSSVVEVERRVAGDRGVAVVDCEFCEGEPVGPVVLSSVDEVAKID